MFSGDTPGEDSQPLLNSMRSIQINTVLQRYCFDWTVTDFLRNIVLSDYNIIFYYTCQAKKQETLIDSGKKLILLN